MISSAIYTTIDLVNERTLYRLCDCSAGPGRELQAEMYMTPELADRLNARVRATNDYARWFKAD